LQSALFTLGAELAAPDPQTLGMALLGESDVAEVEAAIDQFDGSLAPLRSFILPGGTLAAAQLHVARCVCRRAERSMVALHEREPLRDVLLHYVNRVSDLLFVLARAANASAGVPDVPWQSPRKAGS
jgi:cob(I)alamin adenosyltransferase